MEPEILHEKVMHAINQIEDHNDEIPKELMKLINDEGIYVLVKLSHMNNTATMAIYNCDPT